MSQYWLKREADALAKADTAPAEGLKAIYLQLAAHYRTLHDESKPSTDRGSND